MNMIYIKPSTRVEVLYLEQNLLYSGLKDMPDNPIYPGEELEGDE